jgi:hypothetical protein
VKRYGTGRRHKSLLLPGISLVAAFLLTCGLALTLEASEEVSQLTISGAAPADVSPAATPQAEKSARNSGNPATPLPASNSPNGAVPARMEGHGKAARVVMDESLMVTTIATKNPDGSISIEYVTGNENAAKAVAEGQTTYPPQRKEN